MGPRGVMSTRATPARIPAAPSGTAARANRRMLLIVPPLLPPDDCRVHFAHRRDGIVGVALRVLGIQHHAGKAAKNVDGARAALAAVADGFPPLVTETRPSRRHRHLPFDLRHDGQNHRAPRRGYRYTLGHHRSEERRVGKERRSRWSPY